MTIQEAQRIKLSENFTLYEFLISDDAVKYGLVEQQLAISEVYILHLRKLCENILQPLRNRIRIPIKINSGYRNEDLNERVGGSKTSDHLFGKAADIYCASKMLESFQFIKYNCSFKQLIDEENLTWIHISFDEFDNKKEILFL